MTCHMTDEEELKGKQKAKEIEEALSNIEYGTPLLIKLEPEEETHKENPQSIGFFGGYGNYEITLWLDKDGKKRGDYIRSMQHQYPVFSGEISEIRVLGRRGRQIYKEAG